jgi:YHS domain-containing protein
MGAAVLVVCFLVSNEVRSEEKAEKAGQILCPVSGKPASFSHKVMTDDGPVFFCCDNCPKKFKADPAAYSEKVEAQRKVLATLPRVQTSCPMSGKPINKEAFVEQDGKKVYFCCNDCKAEYQKEPAKYKGKLAGSYTYLSVPACPVSGKPVIFANSVMTKDGPVYFCCKGCPKEFEANTAKYEAKAAEQRTALASWPRVQVSCPMSGKPVNSKAFTEVHGKKVYFCCNDCKAEYEKDPAKYKAKLDASYTYQVLCPVTGEEIDPATSADFGGQTVYFCCGGCKGKLADDAAKYAPALSAQGIHIDVPKKTEK